MMTNYSVPFDFDGERFVYVEYLSEKERNLCVYYINQNVKWMHALDKSFGHISHCKLLPNNRLFLVRSLVLCEIREITDDFLVIQNFKHIGDEVIAVDVFRNPSRVLGNEVEMNQINVKRDGLMKLNKPENNVFLQVEELKQDNDEDNLSITLLDIDGNVNVYENLNISKKFNLFEMKDISKDLKEKQFFSMGYPYYIKTSLGFFAISTDHGILLIKRF